MVGCYIVGVLTKNDSPLPDVGQLHYVHARITAPGGSGFDDLRSYELLGRLRSVLEGTREGLRCSSRGVAGYIFTTSLMDTP